MFVARNRGGESDSLLNPELTGLTVVGRHVGAFHAIGAAPLNESTDKQRLQSPITEQFFYFFLRVRKGEIRRMVGILQRQYPDESPEQLARRLVASKSKLSMLGGSLLSLPLLFPGVGQALKLFGVVGATSMLTRMHLYMIMEIALLFGKDIDDAARVPEMVAVVATTGLGAGAPMLVPYLGLDPLQALPVGALGAAAATQLIGRTAIALYVRGAKAQDGIGEVTAQGAAIAA